jgi:Right handed beta helix region
MKYIIRILIFLLSSQLYGLEYFVAKNGNDTNKGSKESPFRSIQYALDKLRLGDICYVREGIYKESIVIHTSGSESNLIQLKAYNNESVILDGTEKVFGNWSIYKDHIYKISAPPGIEQLFVDDEMMIEARWPNMTIHQIFNRDCWAKTDHGSTHGKVICDAIAKTGIDWTGAMACLNVAHQWWTWNRPIGKYQVGSSTLYYNANLVGLCGYDPKFKKEWIDEKWTNNSFYLFGKLEALDIETEWYQNPRTGDLYFYAPKGVDPTSLNVRYKVRNYAISAKNIKYVNISGFKFFAESFCLEDCNFCKIENCELLYPTYSRTITEYDEIRHEAILTKISGDYNQVNHCSIAYSNTLGLLMMGNYNQVMNCIIHDVNWFGTLIYPALQLSASEHLGVNWFSTIQYPPTERTDKNTDVTSFGNKAIQNTLYNCGSSILVYQAANSLIKYNHVYNGGLACKDVSLIYGCWPFSRNSTVCFNWVHGCRTEGYSGVGSLGGIGIRADDQSRHNTFHHNVVWDCGLVGIITKGEGHVVFNNTIFDIGTDQKPQIDILIPDEEEPYKQWAIRWPLLKQQNKTTVVFCNLSRNITSKHTISSIVHDTINIHDNMRDTNIRLLLQNPNNHDYRLNNDIVNKYILDKVGKTINSASFNFLGAYDPNLRPWVAGADWRESYSYSR